MLQGSTHPSSSAPVVWQSDVGADLFHCSVSEPSSSAACTSEGENEGTPENSEESRVLEHLWSGDRPREFFEVDHILASPSADSGCDENPNENGEDRRNGEAMQQATPSAEPHNP